LSLCSAITYGMSDFVGGLLSKRASAWVIAAGSQATATVLTFAVAATNLGEPDASSILLGLIAGLGSGAGNVLIFRGLAGGRMAVVAPLSAITAVSAPVFVGLMTGEQPGAVPLIGTAIALPAVWLVAGGGSTSRRASRVDVVNGLAAGIGFGTQFSALGLVPASAGLTPLAISQVVSVISIILGAAVQGAPWMPRDRFGLLSAVAGLLAGTATVCFQLAVQQGLLTIAAVLASLYPAATVLLAALVLRERIYRTQGVGLALAAAAVVLIASG
jgi:drug/metabolite transporter (DMT)-like permease